MDGLDWTSYELYPAPPTLLCQFRHREGGVPFVGYAKDFHHYFNISGLEWKLTGIAREELDSMPEPVRQQIMPPYQSMYRWALGPALSAPASSLSIVSRRDQRYLDAMQAQGRFGS